MKPKDTVSLTETSAVVYKICCNEGNHNYAEETARKLQASLQELNFAARRLDTNSRLAMHFRETGHTFDFQKTMVGQENSKTERLMLEVWYSDTNYINRRLDLPAAYEILRPYVHEAQDKTITRNSSLFRLVYALVLDSAVIMPTLLGFRVVTDCTPLRAKIRDHGFG
ncbi:unnamed protein product [Schistocephalus solidus]|uniref:Uncharacterized protein n=1 Tax=Schistocephalus solidus TaxID=70667 RepID=A0A183T146_SCHSO|nr:unnamed protein product [Schistocephalus solidus]